MTAKSRRTRVGDYYYSPHVRSVFYQLVLGLLVLAFGYYIFQTISGNLQRLGIRSGFDFLHREGQFLIAQSLIPYSENSSYLRAFFVALLNTLLVGALTIVTATTFGVTIGLMRVSRNPVIAKVAGFYVELNRNIPLLLHLMFWYYVVIASLPVVRQSLQFSGAVLNNRGLIVPAPSATDAYWPFVIGTGIALVAAIVLGWQRRRRRIATGQHQKGAWLIWLPVLCVPTVIVAVLGSPLHWTAPQLTGLMYRGGVRMLPELVAVWIGLTVYHSAYIAEIVRAGVNSVDRVQYEASAALSFTRGKMFRLIILPQAMRVIIPPLGNNILGIIKDTAIGAAIGYPELMQVFWVTVLFQTGQGVEIVAITLGTYLLISLVMSGLINLYNRAYAIPGRG
jgi:general L-amino acid transport system permease protein